MIVGRTALGWLCWWGGGGWGGSKGRASSQSTDIGVFLVFWGQCFLGVFIFLLGKIITKCFFVMILCFLGVVGCLFGFQEAKGNG